MSLRQDISNISTMNGQKAKETLLSGGMERVSTLLMVGTPYATGHHRTQYQV